VDLSPAKLHCGVRDAGEMERQALALRLVAAAGALGEDVMAAHEDGASGSDEIHRVFTGQP